MNDSKSDIPQSKRVLAENELISVILQPHGTDQEIMGFVVDRSAHGFQITIPTEIAPETIVELTITRQANEDTWEFESFIATVRWCEPDELDKNSFNIGIRIQD